MDRLLRLLLGWTVCTTSFLWLVVMRSVLSPDFTWQLLGLSGSRGSGDFWIVILLLIFNAAMLILGRFGPIPPLHLMLLLWHGTLAVVAFTLVVKIEAGAMTPAALSSASLTLLPNTEWAAVITVLSVLTLIWATLDLSRRTQGDQRFDELPTTLPMLRGKNALVLALLLVPVQIFLTASGNTGTQSALLSALTLAQWFLLHFGLFLRQPEPAASQEVGTSASEARLRPGA